MPLNRKVTEKAKDKVCAKAAAPAPKRPLTEMRLAEMERTHVQRILDATGWHKGRAANWIYSFGRFLDIIQSLANIGGPIHAASGLRLRRSSFRLFPWRTRSTRRRSVQRRLAPPRLWSGSGVHQRVGNDESGRRVRSALSTWGMNQ